MTPLTPLATVDDFLGFASNQELAQNEERWSPSNINRLLLRATRAIETRCDRRFAPFTLTETTRAEGVANDSSPNDDVPLDLRGALGRAQSMAFGATALVRDFWLSQYAAAYQDLWTYTVTQIQLVTAYGGTETIPPTSIEGPEPDTGHLRLLLGAFCPPGTTVRFTYSAGYTVEIPDDLVQACIYQAMKIVLIGNEPYARDGLSADILESELLMTLLPYVRY